MSDPTYRGRFAPSPTGPLHAGSLLTALASWLLARHAGGQWLVRIEDVDGPRCVPSAANHQLQTLAAFGLVSDQPVIWQSQRHALYQAALERLLAAGHAFACHCSRTQLAASDGLHHQCVAPPRSDGRHSVRLQAAGSGVIAFNDLLQGPQQQDVAACVGDVVLQRADGCWAYQLAVVVDDAQQGITDVVRGMDLIDSSARQILLQRRLGLPTPNYLHLPLITDAQGRKLSKSLAAVPVDGAHAPALLRWLWGLLGQADGALDGAGSAASLLQRAQPYFDPAALPRQLPACPYNALSQLETHTS